MAPPPIIKINHVVDLLSSRSPPQSSSQYPNTSLDGVASNYNFICNIPYKYWKICFAAIQCSMLGLAMCWLTHLMGMPSWVMCTTWHTSRTQLLVDVEILSIHHFHLHSFVTSLWDKMELPWAYIPPFEKHFNICLRYLIWLMCRSHSSQFLSTSIPKKKCNSPRSWISNFWPNSYLICKSLFWSLHTKMRSST
jgi:hypothetical protein